MGISLVDHNVFGCSAISLSRMGNGGSFVWIRSCTGSFVGHASLNQHSSLFALETLFCHKVLAAITIIKENTMPIFHQQCLILTYLFYQE